MGIYCFVWVKKAIWVTWKKMFNWLLSIYSETMPCLLNNMCPNEESVVLLCVKKCPKHTCSTQGYYCQGIISVIGRIFWAILSPWKFRGSFPPALNVPTVIPKSLGIAFLYRVFLIVREMRPSCLVAWSLLNCFQLIDLWKPLNSHKEYTLWILDVGKVMSQANQGALGKPWPFCRLPVPRKQSYFQITSVVVLLSF